MIEYENLAKVNATFFEKYEKSFREVMHSGRYVLGEKVNTFEDLFADYCGVAGCVGVASGLDALTLALRALNLPKNAEVLVPSNTYIASVLAICSAGLTPVLVEPRMETYNINPENIRDKIGKKTAAILVVHLYGKPCEIPEIVALANEFNLAIVEDCAQAHGASVGGKKVGSFGLGAFSFYPTKNLGALGDAGGITFNDEEKREVLLALRNYGSRVKYYNDYLGYNSRLDEIQAGFLVEKLKWLDSINAHKRKLAKIYDAHLSNKLIKPIQQAGYEDVFHIYNIRYGQRDSLKNFLEEYGVKTEIHYPLPPHRQKCMSGVLEGNYPISDEIHGTTLSLPISYMHTPEDIEKVCELCNQFVRGK